MHDSEVVASIAGDRSDGLTEAYDRYADQLYQYCLAALGNPAEAADAVQDTFVIAAAKVAGLREPNRLRAWLYAVTRNECQRIGPVFTSAYGPYLTAGADRMGDLLEAATAGLTPGERELMELELRQGLAVDEIAAVIGVSRGQASALASRARAHLEAGLAAVVVARAGRTHCGWLASVLADWDGQLTVPLRTQLERHIGRCATCSTRRDLELHPGRLNGNSLGEAMAAAAAASLLAVAAPPDVVRARALTLAAGQDPDAIAQRDAVLGQAGAFDSHGFPQPARWDGGSAPRTGRFAVMAGLVAAAVIAAVAVVLIGSAGHGKQPTRPSAAPLRAVPGTPVTSPASSAASAARTAPRKTASSATTAPPGTPTAANHATTSAAPPSATTSATTTPTAPTTTPAAKVVAGTLAVSPSGGTLVVPPGGTTISLTAQGGPVTWSSSVSSGSGSVHVRPSGGTVNTGASVTVTVTASGGASGRKVTINPGGTVFTIFVSLL